MAGLAGLSHSTTAVAMCCCPVKQGGGMVAPSVCRVPCFQKCEVFALTPGTTAFAQLSMAEVSWENAARNEAATHGAVPMQPWVREAVE